MKTASTYILGSNIFAQLLILGSTPFLTRVYTKADFGWFGVSTTVAILLATLISMRLEHSIHLERSQSARMYSCCLFVIGFMGFCIVLPAMWLAKTDLIADSVSNYGFIWLFALGHATVACGTLFLNSQQRFKTIAVVNSVIPIIFIGGALLPIQLSDSANQLLVWQSIAYACGALFTIVLNAKDILFIGWRAALGLLKREKDSVLFLVPSSLISIFTLNLPVLVTTALFSESAAGLVVIAQRVARAPITVIGNGLNEVLRSTIPARVAMKRTFEKVFYLCLLMSALMMVVVWLVPESVYLWILGDEWIGLRVVLLATVAGAIFQLLGTSVMSLLSSFEKQSEFRINLLLLAVGLFAALCAWLLPIHNIGYLWLHMITAAGIFLYALLLAKSIATRETP